MTSRSLKADPELQLALACLSQSLGFTPQQPPEALLRQDLDWDRFLQISDWHRLDALIYQAISEGNDRIPEPVMAQLRERRLFAARHSLLQAGALIRVANLFKTHHIPFLYFKGQALALALYGDAAMRRSRDLDLLVAPEDVTRAVRLLREEVGLKPLEELTPLQEEKLISGHNELELEGGGARFEIHWRFAYIRDVCPIETGPLLAQPEWVEIAGQKIPTMPMRHMIPYLGYHGNAHVWKRIFWICDLAAATRKPLNWEEILKLAEELKQRRALLLGLSLAAELLNAPLPEPVQKAANEDAQLPALVNDNLAFLFRRGPQPYQCEDSLKTRLSWTLRAQDNAADRRKLLMLYLFQPRLNDYGVITLPAPLHPAYRLIRPMRLLWRGLRGEE